MAFMAPIAAAVSTAASTAASTIGSWLGFGGSAAAAGGSAAAAGAAGGGMSASGILGLIGTGVSAISSIMKGSSQKEMAEYNAKVAEAEGVAKENAAAYEERMFQRKMDRLLAGQRVGYAKSGVVNEGTPLLVMQDTVGQGEMDSQAILYGGAVGKSRALSQASMYRLYGEQAEAEGWLGAGTSLLSGAANYFANRGKFR